MGNVQGKRIWHLQANEDWRGKRSDAHCNYQRFVLLAQWPAGCRHGMKYRSSYDF